MSWRALVLVAGVVLTSSFARSQGVPATPPTSPPVTQQAEAKTYRYARASSALTAAIDLHRRGEIEQASILFDEVRQRSSELKPTEQQEFARFQQVNQDMLKNRQQARDTLDQAELAFQQGQAARGNELLKQIAAVEHALAAHDRQRYDQLRRGNTPLTQTRTTTTTTTPAGTNDQLARTKLQQARALLQQGNLDGAEQLAKEADGLGVTFGAREDKPARVIEDIKKTRNDPKTLLASSRAAMQSGDLDRAQLLAEAAEKAATTFTFPLWGDTPAKVRKEIQAARKLREKDAPPATPVAEPGKGNGAMQPAPVGSSDAPVRTTSAKPVEPAREPARQPVPTTAKPAVKQDARNDKPVEPHEAVALLNQARLLMYTGKLDEAEQAITRARTAQNVKYGLFEDTPEKVMTDLNKLRRKRDAAEADRTLVQARKAYEQGNLAEARTLAYKAQTLHGPYDVWHLGDRPEKLLQDVQVAEARSRKGAAPQVPAAIAQLPTTSTPTAPGNPKTQALLLLAEARKLQSTGRPDQLLAARQKALEAYRLKATFTVNEESPELVLLQLAALAQQRSNQLVQKATVAMNYAQTQPQVLGQAELDLKQARELTAGFGLDTTPIDNRLSQVTVARLHASGTPNGLQQAGATMPVPPATTAQVDSKDPAVQQGLKLLQDSLLELRRGNTLGARKLAEEAYLDQYKVKTLAKARLGEIDIEEFNQRKLTARRSFDAGVTAFNRRDYPAARAILTSINVHDLKDDRLSRYRELMASPELGLKDAGMAVATGPTVADKQPGGVTQASTLPKTGGLSSLPEDAGQAKASDTEDLMGATRAMQSVLFQKVRSESLQVQQEANDRFRAGEMQAAIELLQDFMLKLPESQLERDQLALIKRPIEGRLQRFKLLKQQDEYYKQDADTSKLAMSGIKSKEANERNKQKNVAELMKQFNTYFKEGKYKEAEMYAMLAHDVDPDNHVVSAAVGMAKMQQRVTDASSLKARREEFMLKGLNEADEVGPAVNSSNPLAVDKETSLKARKRGDLSGFQVGGRKNEKVKEIERRLDLPVTLNFNNAPLRQVIDDLRALHGINIVPDAFALEQENISLERPITIQVENLALKSALNIALRQARLTWVIRDDVLQITTEAHARGKLMQKTFLVADLIVPVENFSQPANPLTPPSKQQQHGPVPHGGPQSLQQGTPIGSPGSGSPSSFASSPNNMTVTKTAAQQTLQDQLIKLITSSIAPKSWSDMGGPGTIDYFPLTMSLVINQTQDIQEQIADLLAALRRLQDQEVAIEVRLITIAEGFYERMGLDFNIKIKTDGETARFEPALTTGTFKPAGFVNDFNPSRFIAGLTPAGTFTNDLDIPIGSNTFSRAIPPFGPYPNMPGDNGGIALGLAFLSDIQVALFMEAAQGDQRSNVMQAPKLTMFNGQTASLNVSTFQSFITGVSVNQDQSNGLIFFVPENTPIPQGVNLTLQPVISADRRFVRLSSAITLSNLASATVPLFPIITPITPIFAGGGTTGQPMIFTQFIQQPVVSTVSVQTTVVVPDGGTVLMGGLKRMSEGRNEYGPPVLSKIPYINRLFKNVGYGRDTESLLMMVTPRIIISEEEEITQTGVVSSPQLSQ